MAGEDIDVVLPVRRPLLELTTVDAPHPVVGFNNRLRGAAGPVT